MIEKIHVCILWFESIKLENGITDLGIQPSRFNF